MIEKCKQPSVLVTVVLTAVTQSEFMKLEMHMLKVVKLWNITRPIAASL